MAVAMQKFPPAESPTSTMCSPVVPGERGEVGREGEEGRRRGMGGRGKG